MKNSRPWAALFAVVVLAAMVVLAGCQGAVGKPGPAGKDGADGVTGPAGPAGPAGTSDNEPPVAKDIPTVYLALNGEATLPSPGPTASSSSGYKDRTVDLTKYFTDVESPTLSYTATSTDKTITTDAATTTGVVADGKLTIKAAKAGLAAIIVTASDNVNAVGTSTTINVIVVASNSPPTASITKSIDPLIGPRKLVTDSPMDYPFTVTINAGVSGESSEVTTVRAFVGTSAATETKYVKAFVSYVSGNDYSLKVTRLKAGLNDQSVTQTITLLATDSFGAETVVDTLEVEVNAPPREAQPLPDVVLYRLNKETGDASIAPSKKRSAVYFTIKDFFAVEYTDDATAETTCVFSTNPKQPTGAKADVTKGVLADPITANTKASVVGTYSRIKDKKGIVLRTVLDKVTVDALAPGALGVENFDLTITCSDNEKSVPAMATITVVAS